MKNLLTMNLFLFLIFFIGCKDDNPVSPQPPSDFQKAGPLGLIIVAENMEIGGGSLETIFLYKKKEMIQILSGIFNVDTTKLQNLTLTQIVEIYGEPWMISSLRGVAASHYAHIVSLTGITATKKGFIDSLKVLTSEGLNIDVMFSLHGDSSNVLFFDGLYPIATITSDIKSNKIHMRSLYQTCCYGSGMIDDWENINLSAVNGSIGLNDLSMYSPVAFLKYWIGGQTFSSAVKNAYQKEIDTLMTYQNVLPEIKYFLTSDVLKASEQKIGGTKPDLLWTEAPVYHRRLLYSLQ